MGDLYTIRGVAAATGRKIEHTLFAESAQDAEARALAAGITSVTVVAAPDGPQFGVPPALETVPSSNGGQPHG